MAKKNKTEQTMVKKRVQQIMTLKNMDYDTWLNQQHERFLNENMACIDEIIEKVYCAIVFYKKMQPKVQSFAATSFFLQYDLDNEFFNLKLSPLKLIM